MSNPLVIIGQGDSATEIREEDVCPVIAGRIVTTFYTDGRVSYEYKLTEGRQIPEESRHCHQCIASMVEYAVQSHMQGRD